MAEPDKKVEEQNFEIESQNIENDIKQKGK